MPRHFSEEEKKKIKEKLLIAAKELFLLYGINKTNIVDITSKAGVGKGTFYSFFTSKGDIYMQLYSDEWKSVHHFLDEKYKFKKGAITDLILDYTFENRQLLMNHPLLSVIYDRQTLSLISEPAVAAQIVSFRELSDQWLIELIESWYEANHIQTTVKPEIISGMMRSLSYLNYHKDEIGENIFEDVIKNFASGITWIVTQTKE